MRGRCGRAVIAALVVIGLSACATYRDQLARGQDAFDRNEHERSLAILRDLERDVGRLSVADQARYAYLRGMTDYRIGYRADARYWLAIAQAYEEGAPGVLPVAWKTRTTEALGEMNAIVHAEGTRALTIARRSDDAP